MVTLLWKGPCIYRHLTTIYLTQKAGNIQPIWTVLLTYLEYQWCPFILALTSSGGS